MKKQTQRIFVIRITDKRIACRIHKDLLKLNSKMTKKIFSEQKILRHSQKRIYKWPRNATKNNCYISCQGNAD
jgi:hypothetical protein